MKCPCHSEKEYENCCAPFHKGENPPNALLLMRSRYAAYALKDIDYIQKTTHPSHPQSGMPSEKRRAQMLNFMKKTNFKGLEIVDFTEEGDVAFVTFKAILSERGRGASFIEKSKFIREKGVWLYASGEYKAL